MSDFQCEKGIQDNIKRQEKVSLLFIFKHMKVIQDALLYNKIECYNKEVQKKSLSLSKRLHLLLKAFTLLQIQDVWKSVEERLINVETIGC